VGLPTNRAFRFFYQVFTNLAASLTTILVSLYSATLRIEVVGEENLLLLKLKGESFIVTVWHTFVEVAVLCLHSRDFVIYSDHPRTESYEKSGHHLAREVGIKTVNALGFDVLDASLEKQSVALLKFIRKIRRGAPALIAPDGPDGPIYKAKAGAVYIAQKTRSAILPVGFSFSRFITLRNWDDFVLPLPFSRIVMVVGDPMMIRGRLSGGELDESAARLEKRLDALCHRAGEILTEEGGA
jgi:lysophospholipid acyltransferase (LPLAT)-like uncharacterized protein